MRQPTPVFAMSRSQHELNVIGHECMNPETSGRRGHAALQNWYDRSENEHTPLPAAVYTCPELLVAELKALFHRQWICCGHQSQLSEPGDYLTVEVGGVPVLLVCDTQCEIRALSNICLHRAARIVEGCGRTRRFSCPYHAWTYKLDGRLDKAPFMDEADLSSHRLPAYAVELWHGLVFVCLDPAADSLATKLTGLTERMNPYKLEGGRVVDSSRHPMACNWKLLVENFCESYHVFRVHPQSVEPSSPSRTTRVWDGGPGFNAHTQALLKPGHDTSADYESHPGYENEIRLCCLYPSFVFSAHPELLISLSVHPTGPQTCEYLCLAVALHPMPDEEVSPLVNRVHAFLAEDRAVIEGVQRNLSTGHDPIGPLHEWERTNWHFGRYIAEHVL